MKCLLLIAMMITWALPADAEEALYLGDDVLPLTIHGPLAKLARSAEDADDVPGRLELEDGTSIPMTFTKFGISRLRECGVPSLTITLDPDLVPQFRRLQVIDKQSEHSYSEPQCGTEPEYGFIGGKVGSVVITFDVIGEGRDNIKVLMDLLFCHEVDFVSVGARETGPACI